MKTLLTFLATAVACFTLGSTELSAGESRTARPTATVRPACQKTESRRSAANTVCRCGVTPAYVYRYGNPMAPVSARVYGYRSLREARFYENYPTPRGR